MDCTIRVAKTKPLISFAVTPKLICGFVFAYAKSRFSHEEAHVMIANLQFSLLQTHFALHFLVILLLLTGKSGIKKSAKVVSFVIVIAGVGLV